ncbi:MAG: NERD domain-containing protein [Actinomycetia bacterium]|nr:NERD domain-containing protein [Actinomycetes bacterium]
MAEQPLPATRPAKNATVLGRPGAHATKLAVRAMWRAGLPAVVAAAGLAIAAHANGLLQMAAVLVAVAGLAIAEHFRGAVHRAWVGASAERRVAAALRRMGPVALVNGALLGAGGDADHVVLGPIAALVETKHGRGRIRVDDSGFYVGGRRLARDPIAQARRQATAAGQRIGCYCTAVVCVVDSTSRPFWHRDVLVTNLKDLPGALSGLRPAPLDGAMALAAAARIASKG